MRNEDFDPLAYIENAFLDRNPRSTPEPTKAESNGVAPKSSATATAVKSETAADHGSNGELRLPTIADFQPKANGVEKGDESDDLKGRRRFRKTEMRAPRPRRTSTDDHKPQIDPALQSVWEALPRNMDFLVSFYDDSVTANYYGGEFKESRESLVRRLLDPEITLEETSRLLGVCPATVRRYTNRGWLSHHRTSGGQRRFRLSDLVRFVEVHGRFPED